MERIEIKALWKENIGDMVYLNSTVRFGGGEHRLYYSVSREHEDALTDKVADGILVTLLPFALRNGYDIVSEVPVSEKLYYNLTATVIPQMVVCSEDNHEISLTAPTITPDFSPTEVGTGMSMGIDSLTTLKEYTEDCELEDYRLTCFTYFEAGAHHMGRVGYASEKEKLFLEQRDRAVQFCKKYGYKLIAVRSNVNAFLGEVFGDDSFDRTVTYRNIGIVLQMQTLFRLYYYSATYNLSFFKVDMRDDSAHYENWLLPYLSTECTAIYNSNKAMTRIEKAQYISDFPQSYDNLLVCVKQKTNCGYCKKCVQTLAALDFLGVLDSYKNSFDVDGYRKNRAKRLARLYSHEQQDEYFEKLREYAREHGIRIPLMSKVYGRAYDAMDFFAQKMPGTHEWLIKLIKNLG